jgi:hypothetical protein
MHWDGKKSQFPCIPLHSIQATYKSFNNRKKILGCYLGIPLRCMLFPVFRYAPYRLPIKALKIVACMERSGIQGIKHAAQLHTIYKSFKNRSLYGAQRNTGNKACSRAAYNICICKIKNPRTCVRRFRNKSLAMTYFHMSCLTLSSAQGGFTSEFEMGSGGSRSPWSPGKLTVLNIGFSFLLAPGALGNVARV